MKSGLLPIVCCVISSLLWLAVPGLGDDAGGVVEKWLAGQADIRSLTADFTQERRLREGRRPIVTEGKFSFKAPGAFRWQMGDPAMTVALQKQDGELVVANLKRKRATVYPRAVLEREEAAMGFSFIEAGFPKTLAEFEKKFSVREVESSDGIHHVTVTVNDRRTSIGLRKMVFAIAEGSYELRGFYLRFRDSSSITMRFTGVQRNPELAEDAFSLDLEGFETKVHEAE